MVDDTAHNSQSVVGSKDSIRIIPETLPRDLLRKALFGKMELVKSLQNVALQNVARYSGASIAHNLWSLHFSWNMRFDIFEKHLWNLIVY